MVKQLMEQLTHELTAFSSKDQNGQGGGGYQLFDRLCRKDGEHRQEAGLNGLVFLECSQHCQLRFLIVSLSMRSMKLIPTTFSRVRWRLQVHLGSAQ